MSRRRFRTRVPSAPEHRVLRDDLQLLTRSVGEDQRAPREPPSAIDQRVEVLERSHAELVDAVTSLTREVANVGERLYESRYDMKLRTALEENSEQDADYARLLRRIREVVRAAVPLDGSVLVVSKGDEELLDLYGRRAQHFPQDETGAYPGYYPCASASAIIQLEGLRARGSDFLLIPQPAFWWLDHYVAFHVHLENRYDALLRDDEVCVIYDLRQPKRPDALALIREAIQEYKDRFDRDPVILDWDSGLGLASALPDHMVFSPPTDDRTLPYIDASVDLVVVAGEGVTSEARRVASGAVVVVQKADAEAENRS
jgi:hypothetical protein